jgi:hypothetical protein
MDSHRLAEERSLAFHRLIAEILERDPVQLDRARGRVRQWQQERSVHAYYVEAWARLLAGPFDELRRMLLADTEEAKALRQMTPFAGVVDPRTRWKIWRETRERLGTSS